MRRAPKSAAVLLIIALTAFGLYYYLVNKAERPEPDVTTTAIQDVLLKDLEKDYPATVREVMKYYNEIMRCYYNESPNDADLKKLANKALELYDKELVDYQSEEMYLDNLEMEVKDLAEKGAILSHVAISSSTAVDYYTHNGRECAQIRCIYTMRQKAELYTSNETYVLRRDDKGRWKILGWTASDKEAEAQK